MTCGRKLDVGGGYTVRFVTSSESAWRRSLNLLHTFATLRAALCSKNQVFDQNYNYAVFQDLGSSPATLQAAKVVDVFGCLPDHAIEIADDEQAYIQADMQGDPT